MADSGEILFWNAGGWVGPSIDKKGLGRLARPVAPSGQSTRLSAAAGSAARPVDLTQR
jgi:hypothetical protein